MANLNVVDAAAAAALVAATAMAPMLGDWATMGLFGTVGAVTGMQYRKDLISAYKRLLSGFVGVASSLAFSWAIAVYISTKLSIPVQGFLYAVPFGIGFAGDSWVSLIPSVFRAIVSALLPGFKPPP